MIHLKKPEELNLMRTSGRIAAEILRKVASAVRPGITTRELDKLAEELIFSYAKKYEKGALTHAFKGYQGFPGVLCSSVNEVIVHGIPDDMPLKEGDNVGLDFGVIFKGWYSDTAVTVPVGEVSFETQRILRVCKKALRLGIKKAKQGYFGYMLFNLNPRDLKSLDKKLRLEDYILRYLVITVDNNYLSFMKRQEEEIKEKFQRITQPSESQSRKSVKSEDKLKLEAEIEKKLEEILEKTS